MSVSTRLLTQSLKSGLVSSCFWESDSKAMARKASSEYRGGEAPGLVSMGRSGVAHSTSRALGDRRDFSRACVQILDHALPIHWIRGTQRDSMEDVSEMLLNQSAHRHNFHAILGIKWGSLRRRQSLDSLTTKIVDFATHLHARLLVGNGLHVRGDAVRSIKGYTSQRCRQIIEHPLEVGRGKPRKQGSHA